MYFIPPWLRTSFKMICMIFKCYFPTKYNVQNWYPCNFPKQDLKFKIYIQVCLFITSLQFPKSKTDIIILLLQSNFDTHVSFPTNPKCILIRTHRSSFSSNRQTEGRKDIVQALPDDQALPRRVLLLLQARVCFQRANVQQQMPDENVELRVSPHSFWEWIYVDVKVAHSKAQNVWLLMNWLTASL